MNNGQKIQNPEMPITKTPEMNDRDFLNDMLATEKYIHTSYTYAINEASTDSLFQDLLQISNETAQCQHSIFKTMFQKGFYALEAANTQQLAQSYQQFSGYRQQFPYH